MISFINILLVLIQVSRCQDKTDIKIVRSCPTSKEEWDSAAKQKKCSKFVALDTLEEQYEYHCLINAFSNETLEVCAPKKFIFGYCTEFNVAGRFIQHHEEAKCNAIYPKCDKVYSSADAYKYPDCYRIVYDKREKDYTTYLPQENTTFVKSKDLEDNGNTGAIVAAITTSVFVILIIIVVILAILFIKKKRAGKKGKEFDKEEVQHLTDIEAVNAINEGEESIEYFHFKVSKDFDHFMYIYNLTREYTSNNVFLNEMQLKDIIFEIGVVGKFTDDNLNLFPKGNVLAIEK